MSFKVTWFNPYTGRIRRRVCKFEWDGFNHCWWDGDRPFYGEPKLAVQHMAEAMCRDGEFITIK